MGTRLIIGNSVVQSQGLFFVALFKLPNKYSGSSLL